MAWGSPFRVALSTLRSWRTTRLSLTTGPPRVTRAFTARRIAPPSLAWASPAQFSLGSSTPPWHVSLLTDPSFQSEHDTCGPRSLHVRETALVHLVKRPEDS